MISNTLSLLWIYSHLGTKLRASYMLVTTLPAELQPQLSSIGIYVYYIPIIFTVCQELIQININFLKYYENPMELILLCLI